MLAEASSILARIATAIEWSIGCLQTKPLLCCIFYRWRQLWTVCYLC